MKFNNVLLLSPHTDDVEFSAGGTVARLVEEGAEMKALMFSVPNMVLFEECKNALAILGVENYEFLDFRRRIFPQCRQQILDYLYEYNQKNRIDLVLTPSTLDFHQDHQTVTNEALRAFKQSTILGYEMPGNHILLRENCFVELEERHVKKKVESILCYKLEVKLRPHHFNESFIRSVLISKGGYVKKKYAESFEVIKLVLLL